MFSVRPSFVVVLPRLERVRSYCVSRKYNNDRQRRDHNNDRQRRDRNVNSRQRDRPVLDFPLPHIQGDIIHGIHPVSAALHKQQREIYTAFFKNHHHDTDNRRIEVLRDICADKRIPMLEVSGSVLDDMTQGMSHQGICLDVSPLPCEVLRDSDLCMETITSPCGKPELWLLLHQIKDQMNMGAVLRSAYFFGVKQILVPYRHSAQLNAFTSKASSGALEMLSIKRFSSGTHMYDTMQRWKDLGGVVAGSATNVEGPKGLAVDKYKMDKPTLLVIGNESYGLPGHVNNRCDILLQIEGEHTDSRVTPLMQSEDFKMDSLNVSVATAILLHTILKSR